MTDSVLNTETPQLKSARSRRWVETKHDYYLIDSIARTTSLPPMVAQILSHYIDSPTSAENYLNPKLKNLLSDPLTIKDMDKAIETIINGFKQNQKIAIFGDYDVDGATSASLLKKILKVYGNNATTYIPDRIKEGYGLNIPAIELLKEQGHDLIITVDCGSTSHNEIKKARELGMHVVVLDHHKCSTDLPEADAIVNPNRIDDTSGYTYLAAVGVTFLFALALNSEMKKCGLATDTTINMFDYLDLVALGTVCDVVPLIGLNRALVRQGIKVVQAKKNIGIKALMDISGINTELSVYHIGYVLGPRINAGGRVGESNLGVELLTNNDYEQSISLAAKLDTYNIERKNIEFLVLEDAKKQAAKIDKNSAAIIVSGKNWHPGVIGIVAGRLKETYYKPTAVIAIENGIGKASCRSIDGIDFGSTVIDAKNKGLLVNGGGHAMAAGFTVLEENVEKLIEFFNAEFTDDYSVIKENSASHYLSNIPTQAITVELVNYIEKLGPFGSGNPQPKFMIRNAKIIKPKILKDLHISCLVAGTEINLNNRYVKAIAFSAMESSIGEILLSDRANLSLIVTLDINTWQDNESVQLIIHDIILN
jgi:single-stranded-DNA-specific exonuclease